MVLSKENSAESQWINSCKIAEIVLVTMSEDSLWRVSEGATGGIPVKLVEKSLE